MNATTKTTLDLAKTLAKSGFHIPAIEIHTPDGRTWNIATVPAGRGRHLDGHWGPRPGALGGFRLFEIDRDTDAPNEHDAIDGDTWAADELVDYLRAVGQPRTRRVGTARTTTTRRPEARVMRASLFTRDHQPKGARP
jgi:hypothetical protein